MHRGATIFAVLAQLSSALIDIPQEPLTDPMFAASPQRELWREWNQCIGEARRLAVMNNASQEQALSFVYSACEDDQSRLTGEMVRKFGLTRGSAAMARAKEQFTIAIKKQFRPAPKPSQPVARPSVRIGDWEVVKLKGGGCEAFLPERRAPVYPSTLIIADGKQTEVIKFQMRVFSPLAQYNGKVLAEHLVVVDEKGDRTEPLLMRFLLAVRPDNEQGDTRVEFMTLVTADLRSKLNAANEVELGITTSSSPPMRFPARGFAAALAGVQQCAAAPK